MAVSKTPPNNIKKEKNMYTEKTLKRFCKDFSLPINNTRPESFDYYTCLYDDDFDVSEKLKMLGDAIRDAGGEVEFANKRSEIIDKMITTIADTEAYKNMLKLKMQLLYPLANEVRGIKRKQSDVYNPQNVGKQMVSIDLTNANIQALRYINPAIVLNAKDYPDLVSKFTDWEYIKASKHIRQIVFGKLNVKRQIHIENYLISKVTEYLCDEIGLKAEDVLVLTNDELVFMAQNYNIRNIRTKIQEELGIFVHVEEFEIDKIPDIEHGYVKKIHPDGTIKFKGVPPIYFAQVYKKYYNQPIEGLDLTFIYEGKLAKFL